MRIVYFREALFLHNNYSHHDANDHHHVWCCPLGQPISALVANPLFILKIKIYYVELTLVINVGIVCFQF